MNKFPIHVDAFELSADFERFLVEDRGSAEAISPDIRRAWEGYEPPHHLTLKLNDGNQFRVCFDEVAARARQDVSMRGYVEGEFIAEDLTIPEKPLILRSRRRSAPRKPLFPPVRFVKARSM